MNWYGANIAGAVLLMSMASCMQTHAQAPRDGSFRTAALQKKSPQKPSAKKTALPAPKKGGRYMTSSGTLNALFVYVQFPDDKYLPQSANWPKGKAPSYLSETIDRAWSATPTKGGFTDYFNLMSAGKLKITGQSVSVITPHARSWYLKNGKRRDFITEETIRKLDETMDFAPFDRWTVKGEYAIANAPDGVVDLVFMMWRNVCSDTADVRAALDLVPGGEASLGYAPPYTVDGGARTIQTGYGGNGSGITVIHPMSSDLNREIMFRYARHEFGHWLLGANEFHTDLGTWGLIDGWGSPSGCMNSYERNKLGWISATTVDDISTKRTIRNVRLADFVTTGAAYRIRVPGGGPDEYYLLENHQRISPYDIPDNNTPEAKGLFVLLQKSDQGNAVGVVSAAGRYVWTVPQQLPNSYGGSGELPVFKRGAADRVNGYSKRQYIPWSWNGAAQTPAAIHYHIDPVTGAVRKAPPTIFTGDGKDQFDLANATVFSPASNPSSDLHNNADKIGFEITGMDRGTVVFNIHINTTEEAAPSKPQDVAARRAADNIVTVTWDPNPESDVKNGGSYNIVREIVAGNSVLSRFEKINASPVRQPAYTDRIGRQSVKGAPEGADVYVRYCIEAVDEGGRVSVRSEPGVCSLGR